MKKKIIKPKNNLAYEREYEGRGYKLIAGCDEAGRGPLAGPVSCAAVIMPLDEIHPEIDDSKKLSPKKREELYDYIARRAVAWAFSFTDNRVIDEINILRATMRGMEAALAALNPAPDVALIDAVKGLNAPFPTAPIIRGDALSYNIAAASIIAKVERDRLMTRYASEYPRYEFDRHMGYGTPRHIELLRTFGPCPIHRRTFTEGILNGRK